MAADESPSGSGDLVFGMVRVADLDLAVPLAALREVAPCPERLAALPATAEGLLGAARLRSQVLSVLDLGQLLGRPTPRTPDQSIVALAGDGTALALLVDEVRDLVTLRAEDLLAVRAHEQALLFSHAFIQPDTDRVVSVLDAGALLRRPGVPLVTDPHLVSITENDERGALGDSRRVVVGRCGPHLLAFDIAQVRTTLPQFSCRSSVLEGPLCRGVATFAGSEVPVADPLVLLGLGRLDPSEISAGLVLDFGHGYTLLAMNALIDLVTLEEHEVLAFPPAAAARPDLLTGTTRLADASAALVLDGTALLQDADLVTLASVNTAVEAAAGLEPAGTPAQTRSTGHTGKIEDTVEHVGPGQDGPGGRQDGAHGPAYLVYSAAARLSSPLEQVVEILPYPDDLIDTGGDGAVLGVVLHRDSALPVFCLATMLGGRRHVRTAGSCLLLVEVEGTQVALAVDRLEAIEPLSWRDPEAPSPVDRADPQARLSAAPLVQIGDENLLLPEIDLAALIPASALRAEAATATPSPSPSAEGAFA